MARRQPVKSLNQSAEEVATAAAAEKARKAASRKALRDAAKSTAAAAPVAAEPAPVVDHSAEYAANALIAAQVDADALGVPVEQVLADMGLNAGGTPAEPTDKQRYAGPMLALVAARKHYAKAANGILCNGDDLATLCGAHDRATTVSALGQLLFAKGLTTSTNPYLSLNPGQQSMNLRNKARHALRNGAITLQDVRTAYANA